MEIKKENTVKININIKTTIVIMTDKASSEIPSK